VVIWQRHSNPDRDPAMSEIPLTQPAADPRHWLLDQHVVFMNHGSFGACPRVVLDYQSEIRSRLERQPVQFLGRDLEGLLDSARGALAQFVGADPDDIVAVPNATAGVNTVLRSLAFQPGDELIVTNQEYNACRNALEFAAARSAAPAVLVKMPFPVASPDDIVAAVLERVTPRTRLALIDHVTSPTGLILPIERLVSELASRGVDVLVDGAHGPGMVPLDLNRLGAAYYTGNCHKWLCAPKGAAFLHVRRDRQASIRPLIISHGANSRRTDRSRFLIEFGWTGTPDPTAFLSVPEALRFIGSLLPGGWADVMARNRALALAARKILCRALQQPEPAPEDCIGALASVPMPDAGPDEELSQKLHEYGIQRRLREKHRIEVPIFPWPQPPSRLLRVSAQLYNSLPQYELLARAVLEEMEKPSQ
jgi:isopenicillin-N epimerase